MARVRDKHGVYESTKGLKDVDPKEKNEKENEEETSSNGEEESNEKESHSTREEDSDEEEEETSGEEESGEEEEETSGEEESSEEEEERNEGDGVEEEEEKEEDQETETNKSDGEEKEGEKETNSSEGNGEDEAEEDAHDPAPTASSQDDDDDDDTQPLQPENMFFGPSEYTKACKIGTRCSVTQIVEYIEELPAEVKWFRKHSQFKHIFHMHKEPNHMLQGMWMLLLRTSSTEKEKKCWFVVNGVPIWYSLREHVLLTGLDCHEYPNNWKELGVLKFLEKMFKRRKGIKISDVEEKLEAMKKKISMDRKKMIILYFLFKVVKAKSKSDWNIYLFLLSVVDDLEACETFTWGRFTFDELIKEIMRFMKGFKGSVKPKQQTTLSGFILPLEVLAFECIPHLGRKFREDVSAEKDCPRLCKHKFSESCMKSFPLENINLELGITKDITSILEPDSNEKALLARSLDDGFDDGIDFIDPIVESWIEHLTIQRKKIWWKDLYDLDLAARRDEFVENVDGVPERTRFFQ